MSELPKGWTKQKLDNCTSIVMGQSPKGIYVNSEGEGIPFYQGKSEFGKLYPTPRKYCTEPNKLADLNDILLSVRAPVGPTNLCPETSCIGRGLARIRALEPMSQMYFLHYMRYLQPWLGEQGTGTTFKAISGAFLKDIEVLIAPINEQIRIANKLDSILAKVEKAQARLDNIPAILKRFRQSVLAAATSGELTKEWREANQLEFHMVEKRFDELLVELRNGISTKPNENGAGHPILRISAVRAGIVNQEDFRHLECDSKIVEKYRLLPNDILFTRYNGSLDFVGVCGLLKTLSYETLLYPDKLIRARVTEEILPEFIEIYFSSPDAREAMISHVKTTSGQKGISGKDIKNQIVRFPKLLEQKQVISRVSALLAKANKVEKQYLDAKTRLDRLTQSILAKAFHGELVPQDPTDEPAEKLLERIQEERLSSKQKADNLKKTTRKRTTKAKTAEKG